MKVSFADLMITNGWLLPMDSSGNVISNGGVVIAGDRIVSVGTAAELKDWRAKRVIDANGGIILPGLINTHTHAAMTLFRGLADDLPLMSWLNDHIFPAEAKLNAKMVHTGALLACAEMILSGTTCFCDMYLFEDEVAKAAKEAGMRAVTGEVLYDFPSPNYGPIEKGFEYTQDLIEKWRDDPLITIAVEPHSAYLCDPKLLQKAAALALDNNLPLVIHLCETKSEVEDIKKRYGHTPVGHLADLDILGPNLLACHCVVLTKEDIQLLKANDVKVSHNPESNMKLASGIAPLPKMHAAGLCVGLGTDGCSSNNNLDLFAEMDMAAKLHKAQALDPTVADAATILKMVTRDAAKALGLFDRIGSLEVGKKADLIVIDTHKPHLTPLYHPISHLVYAVGGADVCHSVINGELVMEDRRLLTLNTDRILDDVQDIALKIREK
jgi:5-methylthioadenosine/S-adenosylhomocysteine deaminase